MNSREGSAQPDQCLSHAGNLGQVRRARNVVAVGRIAGIPVSRGIPARHDHGGNADEPQPDGAADQAQPQQQVERDVGAGVDAAAAAADEDADTLGQGPDRGECGLKEGGVVSRLTGGKRRKEGGEH